jgi:hypothetical protein
VAYLHTRNRRINGSILEFFFLNEACKGLGGDVEHLIGDATRARAQNTMRKTRENVRIIALHSSQPHLRIEYEAKEMSASNDLSWHKRLAIDNHGLEGAATVNKMNY